jgi:hypothetical protein
MKKYFLTFGGGLMPFLEAVDRLTKQAESLHIFDEIHGLKENDLKADTEFWNRHGNYLINTRGFGYWLWKPYLIKKIYDKMEEGDVLMYCDCGNELDIRKKESIVKLFDIVQTELLLGSYPAEKSKERPPYLNEINWCKRDVLRYLNVEYDSDILNTNQRQGGALVILKCSRTKYLINDWCAITNNNYHLIDDSPSESPNYDCFIEHRHDQSIFSILTKKYNLFSEKTVENEIEILRNPTGISRII